MSAIPHAARRYLAGSVKDRAGKSRLVSLPDNLSRALSALHVSLSCVVLLSYSMMIRKTEKERRDQWTDHQTFDCLRMVDVG